MSNSYRMTITPPPGLSFDISRVNMGMAAEMASFGEIGVYLSGTTVQSSQISFELDCNDPEQVAEHFRRLGTVRYVDTTPEHAETC